MLTSRLFGVWGVLQDHSSSSLGSHPMSNASWHQMMYNYYDALGRAGVDVDRKKKTFIETFAPQAKDTSEVALFVLSLLQIPLGIGLSRFIGGCKCHDFSFLFFGLRVGH